MTLITHLEAIPQLNSPCGLTIGTFDGVHLGHQALLQHLKMQLPPHSPLVVFTFANHPSTLFSPHSPIPLIYPNQEKARLLFESGADIVIMPSFTHSFAETPFEEFLTYLKKQIDFSHLTLGEGSTFGKGRQGDEHHVKKSADKLHFKVEYLPKTLLGTHPISSRRIRIALKSGNFEEARACLGRPYALTGKLFLENESLYLSTEKHLCLPPEGFYNVRLKTPSFTESVRVHIDPVKHEVEIKPIGHNTIPFTQEELQLIF